MNPVGNMNQSVQRPNSNSNTANTNTNGISFNPNNPNLLNSCLPSRSSTGTPTNILHNNNNTNNPTGNSANNNPSSTSSASTVTNKGLGSYCLMGLLNVIRMTDPDLNTLSLGTDLTTLGLNLNSSEVLYATFAYPCLDLPCRSEYDYVLPLCYYMQPPALKTSHLAKFTLETLFYIFYNMPKDTLQVYSAKELYNREWRYHKELKLWFTRATQQQNAASADPNSAANNASAYLYFDISTWERKIFRDTHILQPHKFMTEEELQTL